MPEGMALVYYSDLFGYTIEGIFPEDFVIQAREVNGCFIKESDLKEGRITLNIYTGKKFCITYPMGKYRRVLILVLKKIEEYDIYIEKFENILKANPPPVDVLLAQEFVEDVYKQLIE